jgi:hypothetical protein
MSVQCAIGPKSTHRVAIATSWCTFHQHGKNADEGGGAGPRPFNISTNTYKVVAYAPAAESAVTIHSPYIYSTRVCTLWLGPSDSIVLLSRLKA